MDQLIPIMGYAQTYEELTNKKAESGEFYNCFDVVPFQTYCQTGQPELGDKMMETDVLGWYQVKAELESNVTKPKEGDVYICGITSPYTRYKAQYVDYVMTWVEDGQEEKKIVRNYKNYQMLMRAKLEPEEGIYYSVGKELPMKLYGVVTSWEPVGTFISHCVKNMTQLLNKPTKSNPGEVAYLNGMLYFYDGETWNEIKVKEPMQNVYKHVYEKDGSCYQLREGSRAGTLEFYAPR